MKRSYQLALGLTMAASVLSLMWSSDEAPERPAALKGAQFAAATASSSALRPGQAEGPKPVSTRPLPAELRPLAWHTSKANPFAASTVAAPAPPPPPPQPVAVVVPEKPVPVAPPMRFRVLGVMRVATGELLVYLGKDGSAQEWTAVPGTKLDDGFEVKTLANGEVTLFHAATDTTSRLSVPSLKLNDSP